MSFEYVEVATYTYDAWGEKLHILDSDGNEITSSSNIAIINPLRYRGYYYDTETGWYYLQSRYYDPANHRFINADSYASTDSTDAIACNMFAYCGNNPVNCSDPSGEFCITAFLIVVGVGLVVGAGMGAASAASAGGDADDIFLGALEGGLIGGGIGALSFIPGIGGVIVPAAATLGAATDAGFQVGEELIKNKNLDKFKYNYKRTALVLASSAFSSIGIPGLGPSTCMTDAVATVIVSSDMTMLAGCGEMIIKGIKRLRNQRQQER